MSDIKKTSLYIDEDVLKDLKLQALKEDKKVNEVINELIHDYLYSTKK